LQDYFPGYQAVRDTDSDPADTSQAPSVYRWVPSTNWDTADEVVTYDKLRWAIHFMAPYKSPGVDGIYLVLLQRGLKYISTPRVHIYRTSIAVVYIPRIWRSSRVTFTPKPGKPNMLLLKNLDQSVSLSSY